MAIKASVLKGVNARLSNLETDIIDKTLTLTLYCEKGTGKTTTGAALAQRIRGKGDILLLDSSDGWVSLDNIKALKKNVHHLPNTTYVELAAISDAISRRDPAFKKYSVVILDEVSSWYTELLHDNVREQSGIGPDAVLPEFGWGAYAGPQAAIFSMINKIHNTPGVHLIIMAHEQQRETEKGSGTFRATLSMGQKLNDNIGRISHVVSRATARVAQSKEKNKQNYTRELQSWQTLRVDAKSRIKGLPLKAEQTEFVKILADWVGSSSMEKDMVQPEADEVHEDTVEEEPQDEDYEIEDEDD